MKSSAVLCLALLATLGLASCEESDPVAPADTTGGRSEEFVLPVGGSKILNAQRIEVGFESVPGDSRCPQDVVCAWAGSAAIRLWARPFKTVERTRFELVTNGGNAEADRARVIDGRRITLISLDPYPVSTSPTLPSSYRVKLRVSIDSE